MKFKEGETFKGINSAFKGWKRSSSTLIFSSLIFVLSVLMANIPFTRTILSEGGITYLPTATIIRTTRLFETTGVTGGLLTVLFSLLVGITVTNTITQVSMNRFDKSIAGSIPGFLAGGCASCGVGVLHIFGLGGALAFLPFGGNLLRLGGILLLIGLIRYNGDPETCKIQK